MARQILALFLLHAVCCVFSQVPTKPDDCVVKSADIAFVIDASGSVDSTEWKQSLNFASSVVNGYDVGRDKVRVALIVFSNTAKLVFDFNKYTTKAQVIAALAAAPKESQNTNTHLALDLARNTLFKTGSGMRPGIPNILMVITDGQSTNAQATVASANALKKTGLTVIAVGVKGATLPELKTIASAPTYVYNYGDFTKLVALQDQFKKATCNVVKKLAPTTVPPPTTPKKCLVKAADIAFILDGSGSVGASEWTQSLKFASNIVQGYDIGKDKVRVAMIQFSSSAQILFDFNKYTNKANLMSAITNAKQVSGGTSTDVALNLARTTLFQANRGMRPGIPNIVFVITDGKSGSATRTLASAKALHARGITVFAIGVKGAVQKELEGIASDKSLVSTYTNFNQLSKIQTKFNDAACKVVEKKASPSAGCTLNNADIVFLVDTSTSVGSANFDLTKTFLSNMMTKLDFSKNRVGVVQFNDKPKTVFELSQNNNRAGSQASIRKMVYDKGPSTRISAAIKYMREHSFTAANGDRPNVANLGIIVTDGQAKDPFRTQYEGNETKKAGMQIFTVGIGADINSGELRALASSPSFFFPVKSYSTLASIQSALATVLCQGFTAPTPTKKAPCLCKDNEKDCRGYGTNICFEAKYRVFAQDKCPAFCDLCPVGCKRYIPPPKPCRDNSAANCARLIDICTPKYAQYALENCPRFCNLCDKVNLPTIFQTTTPSTRAPPTTTTARKVPPVPPKPPKFVPCDPNCYDKKRDCKDYNKADCNRKEYGNFFKDGCAEHCGFCTPKASCLATTGPCVNKIDCSGYTQESCAKYPDWALENCPQHCFRCPNQTTPAQTNVCEDKEDCSTYGRDVCTDYPDFSKRKCALYCKLCKPAVPVTTPKCADKRDCTVYKKDYCRNPDYRAFMLNECRAYCNACNDEN